MSARPVRVKVCEASNDGTCASPKCGEGGGCPEPMATTPFYVATMVVLGLLAAVVIALLKWG